MLQIIRNNKRIRKQNIIFVRKFKPERAKWKPAKYSSIRSLWIITNLLIVQIKGPKYVLIELIDSRAWKAIIWVY